MGNKAIHTLQNKVWWKYILFFWDWNLFEKCLLSLNVVVSIIFYILALVHPEHFSGYESKDVAFKPFQTDTARVLLDTLSLITSFVNTCCLILISKGKISNFIWGIIAVALLGFLNLVNGNLGIMIVNLIIQFPMNILGLTMWRKHMKQKKHEDIQMHELNWILKLVVIVILVSFTANFYFVLSNNNVRSFFYYHHADVNNDLAHNLLNAMVLAITIIAVVLLNYRFTDQWYLWILCDFALVALYSVQGLAQLAITWSCGLINACYGLFMWKFKKK